MIAKRPLPSRLRSHVRRPNNAGGTDRSIGYQRRDRRRITPAIPSLPKGRLTRPGRPVIATYLADLHVAQTYTLQGRQINGLSQANSYGDDATMATNYPIVRLQGGGKVFYCRTFGHSTMGMPTGLSVPNRPRY